MQRVTNDIRGRTYSSCAVLRAASDGLHLPCDQDAYSCDGGEFQGILDPQQRPLPWTVLKCAMPNQLPLDPTIAQAIDLNDILQFAEAGIISRTLLATASLRVVLFAFASGQELSEHTSNRRALVHVISGSCSFLFEGSRKHLKAGAFLHMPPHHLHAVRAESGPCALLLTLHTDPGDTNEEVAHTESSSESNA
jgi:quercetin dioxygenase-like cupin family protein